MEPDSLPWRDQGNLELDVLGGVRDSNVYRHYHDRLTGEQPHEKPAEPAKPFPTSVLDPSFFQQFNRPAEANAKQ